MGTSSKGWVREASEAVSWLPQLGQEGQESAMLASLIAVKDTAVAMCSQRMCCGLATLFLGFSLLVPTIASVCSNYFTLLPLSPFDGDSCSLLQNYSSYFSILSLQMITLNSSIAILTQSPLSHCQQNLMGYQNLYFRPINPLELFQEYHLPADRYDPPSVSDILKLLIAHKFQFTYIELGIHFLSTAPADFSEEMFVALQIWDHLKCSQQISNLAFCLSQSALDDLIKEVRESSPSTAPLDYGTSLFTQILPNRYPLRLLSLNHPEVFTFPEIFTDYQDYQHRFLFLPLSLAPSQYWIYVDTLRSELGFPPLFFSPTIDPSPFSWQTPPPLDDVFTHLVSSSSLLEVMPEVDQLLPLFASMEHLLESVKWKVKDENFDRDILQKVQMTLSDLCRHHSPTIQRRSRQLLFLFDIKPL